MPIVGSEQMKHRSQTIGILLLILTSVIPLSGQEEEEKFPSWQGNVSLGMSMNKGNSNTTDFSFDFTADHRFSEKIVWRNSGLVMYGQADRVTTKEAYQLGTALNWNHSARILSYFRVQGVRDRFKNYDYRFLPGLGLGYKLLTREKLKLMLSSGLSLVTTRFYDTGDRDTYAALALSDEFIWDISENAQFNQKWELNFNFEDFGHVVWHLEASLITNLIKSWAVKLTFVNSHDSKPIGDGIKKNDYSFIAGISKKF
jgi:putative salt-induced outer membrane protein YdiY